MNETLFYAKILLFGEYGIIKNSKGLAIPYNTYKGALKKNKILLSSNDKNSNKSLVRFAKFLSDLKNELVVFKIEKLNKDLSEGMYFDSTIPQGYGVGSSGALVAAIYDQYAKNKIVDTDNLTRDKLLELKKIFALMESFFHGKSSGIDPLNSYLAIPLLFHSKEQNIESTGIPMDKKKGRGAVFLLDSNEESNTNSMVDIFMNNMENDIFRKMITEEFIIHTDACIDDFLKRDLKSLFKNVKLLSKVVFNNFKPMIPKPLHKIWEKGINSNNYFLKLCGSGGGGYILGFTEDYEVAKTELNNYKLELVHQF